MKMKSASFYIENTVQLDILVKHFATKTFGISLAPKITSGKTRENQIKPLNFSAE